MFNYHPSRQLSFLNIYKLFTRASVKDLALISKLQQFWSCKQSELAPQSPNSTL